MIVRRIDNLTGVRGFAAVWVVLFHATYLGERAYQFGSVISHGYMGVDLFFVLSGFVLSMVYASKLPPAFSFGWYKNYLLRRFAKIYPLHFLTLILSIALFLTLRHLHYHFVAELHNTTWTALCQFFLIDAFHADWQQSWNTVAWSVSAEWFAYAVLFAPMAYVLRRVRVFWVAGAAVALWVGVIGLCSLVFHQELHYTAGVVRIAPEFLGGYLLYRLMQSRSFSHGDRWTVSGILLMLCVCIGGDRYFIGLLPAVLLLLTGLYLGGHFSDKIFGNPLAIAVGDASYSIYLIQTYITAATNQVMRREHMAIHEGRIAVVIVLVTIITVVCGILVFRFIEEPLRERIVKRFGSRIDRPRVVEDLQTASTIG